MHALVQKNSAGINLHLRDLGMTDYARAWQAMREYSNSRDDDSADEIWCLQHPPVYTLGLNGKSMHILDATDIPVLHVDRGGQVTYHGPGQIVVYLLLDLQRRNLGVKQLVNLIEQATLDTLNEYGIHGERLSGAPGIYVAGSKIAALGLRVRRGYCYHGLALNVDMDLAPFSRINPCGYANMPVTQLADLCTPHPGVTQVQSRLQRHLLHHLGYNAS